MYKWIWALAIMSFSFSQTPEVKIKKLIENKQFNNAEKELLVFLDADPENIIYIALLGDAYAHQKKWNAAIKCYKTLIKRQPKNANYHYKYGGVLGLRALSTSKLKALGSLGDMKRAFLKAIALDPDYIDAYWALIEFYVSLPSFVGGSYSKALNYANKLEALSKLNGYLAKGYIYAYKDEPELEKHYALKAIAISAEVDCEISLTTTVFNGRNALYYQIGEISADYKIQLSKGEKCLKRYVVNHSAKDRVSKAWAYYKLAQIYKHKQDKTKALKWIHEAITGLPKIEVFKSEKDHIENM